LVPVPHTAFADHALWNATFRLITLRTPPRRRTLLAVFPGDDLSTADGCAGETRYDPWCYVGRDFDKSVGLPQFNASDLRPGNPRFAGDRTHYVARTDTVTLADVYVEPGNLGPGCR
jgi:hypothetical protein